MKYIRLEYQRDIFWAVPSDGTAQLLDGAPYENGQLTDRWISLDDCRLLAPCNPGKIVAVGKNYLDHISELSGDSKLPDNPILFIKPTGTIIGPGQAIVLPPETITKRVDHEAELAYVISRRAKNISTAEASEYILGYTCLNDITARDVQQQDGQWTRAKSFDTFAPVGPLLTDEIDPCNVQLKSIVNGVVRQNENSDKQIWNVYELLAFVSRMMTLEPGDLITTGTPAGIGQIKAGDTVTISIEGIGDLTNPVITE